MLAYDPFEQDENTFVTVNCLACKGTHLVNPKTGKAIRAELPLKVAAPSVSPKGRD